ncbi:YceI family protein [Altererythrobacter sp.]|uniref:YceI family protein n=1 Tax=Altererythrobacter sp. TaxID=1872480 RepID=UPI003D022A1A
MLSGRKLLLPVLALAFMAAAPLSYTLDADSSDVTAKVAFFGLASKTAGFPKMSGRVTIVPDKPSEALVDVTIDATRLTAPDGVTLKRLRGEKFFWVEKYPTVHFVGHKLTMRDATHGSVEGKLTARGVTRKEELFVDFDRPPTKAPQGQAITLSGEMEIDRRDYGMTAYRFIVGKKVTIRLKARMVPQLGASK